MAASEIDTGFNAAAYQLPGYSETPIIKAQPDGKLLVALYEFGVNNGIAAQGISRFNPDGTVDTSFRAPRLETGRVYNFGLQSNGKILLIGDFRIENSQYEDIARLNPDGSLDTTFNHIATPLPQQGIEISVQPDDSFFTGTVYKFDANGFPDTTFNYQPYFEPARNIVGLPDGKVYVSAGFAFNYLYRHNADGTRDKSFSPVNVGNPIRKMAVLQDGKLLIAGNFSTVNGVFVGGIARINPDGSLDPTFNAGGTGVNAFLNDMEVLPNGKIIITGGFDTYNGIAKPKVARLNADGSLDNSFTYTGRVENVAGIMAEIIGGGRIMLGGFFYSTDQLQATYIVLNPDGSQVPDFYIQKALAQKIRKTTVASNGKIFVAGEFSTINGYQSRSLARLNPDGKVDTSFVAFFNTLFGINPVVHQLVEQPDGKLLVSFSNYAVVARMNPNGTRDTSFNPTLNASSAVYDLALQTDGKIIIVGEVFGGAPIFSRLSANGSQDTSFNQLVPNGRVFRVLVQLDGKIIIVGEFTQISGVPRNRIARFNSDGTLDNTYNPSADAGIYDLDLQANGKIIIGGAFSSINGNVQCNKVARLNSDGSLDTGFAQSVDTIVQTVKAQPDGKILIGGSFTNVGGTARERLARLNTDGSLDATFTASADALVLDINLQTDGKVLIAGEFITVNNATKLGVARLNNSVTPLRTRFDFDGDGRADLGVMRPSSYIWYQLLGANYNFNWSAYGTSGDILTPADYDGDGKTDISIFRPSSGIWVYGNQQFVTTWGQSGDIPLPSDIDGDGKADFVVFRPSDRTWYRLTNGGGVYTSVAFGAVGDQPVIGDFDGDGKSDPAVFRPSTGEWFYASSSQNGVHLRAALWGLAGDKLVPADYDGDGKTDAAIFRNGLWAINNSSNGSNTILTFGQAGDKPVAADYDGDGRADVGVYRPSDGTWYLLRSTSGFQALTFGASADIPIQNAFVQ